MSEDASTCLRLSFCFSYLEGQFTKGMKVQLARTGKVISLTRPQKMFAQDRSTMETGFAGDGANPRPVPLYAVSIAGTSLLSVNCRLFLTQNILLLFQ